MKERPLVIVSRPLPLPEGDADWSRLTKLANVMVRSSSSAVPLGAHSRIGAARGVVSLLTDAIDAEFFARAGNVAVVANVAVGYDNVDMAEAGKRGVVICNTPDVLTNATAELTIALLFAAARRFKEGEALIRTRSYQGFDLGLLLGRELSGARLGIVGRGRIGRAVAEKARGLGMAVASCTSRGGRGRLAKVLAASDFVSIHCPLTPRTRSLFDARTIARMKRGAYLINTARGEIVDENALLAALDRGHLAGAALDVFRGEPRLDARLRVHPKTFVLPHLGSATREARAAMARLAVRGVVEVLSGRVPRNQVGSPRSVGRGSSAQQRA